IEEAHSERLREPGAAVVGTGAADAEHDLARSALDGVRDQRADAETAGERRIAFVGWDQHEARGGCGLDDGERGRARASYESVAGLDESAEWASDLARNEISASRAGYQLRGPGAA